MPRSLKYIHNQNGWPQFHWDANLIAPLLGATRLAQGRLLGRMETLDEATRGNATLAALTADVLKTSEIEGELLNADQVRSSLARRLGIDIGALKPSDRNVDGVVEMMLDATQNYQSDLDANRLFAWHAALFPSGRSGMTKISVGRWRTSDDDPMQVVSGPMGRERVYYEAPAGKRVAQEMRAFLRWFNSTASQAHDPLIKAAIAHLWFVTIHPFADGNGRIARAVTDMVLARSEESSERYYSMSAEIRAKRQEYYRILEATQKGDLDITDWIAWFLQRLSNAIAGAEDILAGVLQKARFWERHRHQHMNERQLLMLNKVFDGFTGKLTTQKWAKLAKCSHDTALRDINELVEKGVLAKDRAGGRSTSYSLAAPSADRRDVRSG